MPCRKRSEPSQKPRLKFCASPNVVIDPYAGDRSLIQTLRYRVVGPDVVSQRLDLERGARFAFGEVSAA